MSSYTGPIGSADEFGRVVSRPASSRRPRVRSRTFCAAAEAFVPSIAAPVAAGMVRAARRPGISGARADRRGRVLSRAICSAALRRHYYVDCLAYYRIFNDAEYRFYRHSSRPPNQQTDTPFATAANLPATPTETFADGTWYLSVSYFNGVLDSGFIPVGPSGEAYQKIVVSGGQWQTEPPSPPIDWRMEQRAGVVRVIGIYHDGDDRRADEWALAYTTDGSEPVAGFPNVTVDIAESGPGFIDYSLPELSHGTVVKALLQVRRNDGSEAVPSWTYCEAGGSQTVTIDTVGPTAPQSILAMLGQVGIS